MFNDVMRRTVFDDLMLRERMKSAVEAVVGTRKAEKLFPPSMTTIRVRLPKRYG